jgi:hypothetical protein
VNFGEQQRKNKAEQKGWKVKKEQKTEEEK